jgi:hypothetical protein
MESGGAKYLQEQDRTPHPLRSFAVAVAMLVVFYYLALCAQQALRFGAAKAFGAPTVRLQLGVGPPRGGDTTSTFAVGSEWWWGPQTIVKGHMTPTGRQLVDYAGPGLNVLIIIIALIDLRRGRNILHFITIAANLGALLTAYAVSELWS